MSKNIPKFKINVSQGVIHVNSVAVRQATPEAILFVIDCKQKYPAIIGTGSSDENGKHTQSIYIGTSEDTLDVDPNVHEAATNLELTVVEIETDEEYNMSLADDGKYSIHFALIKTDDDSFDDLCWWDGKEDK